MLTSYADAFAHFLHIRKGTNLSSYTKLYLSFAISGFFHAYSQLQMPSPINITSFERTTGVLYFFLLQPVLITVEDFAQWIARNGYVPGMKKENTFVRIFIGWVWIVGCLWATVPLAGDTFLRMRMGMESLLPFSISRNIVERYVPVRGG
jgi:hypothetical protein